MGAEASKLSPEEMVAIEKKAVKDVDDGIEEYAKEFRKQRPLNKRKKTDREPQPRPVQSSIRNDDLESGEILTDSASASAAIPIRSGNSSQSASVANELLASFKPRKERDPETRPIQSNDARGKHSSRPDSRQPGKEQPRIDTAGDSIKVAQRKPFVTSSTSPIKTNNLTPASARPKKRPAEGSGEVTRPINSSALSSMPKIQKRTSVAPPQSPDRTDDAQRVVDDNERPPRWYKALTATNSRNKSDGGIDILLTSLRDEIRRAKKMVGSQDAQARNKVFTEIRHKLHTIIFQPVNAQILKNKRMLHNEDGLPQIFDRNFSNGIKWPYDIKADAKEVYIKWCRRDFSTDIMRGIKFALKGTQNDSGESIDPNYKGVVSAKYHGNGDLLNGQWWPLRICALRDGAHGLTQGGIFGATGEGAYSVVMSGGLDSQGQPYPDEDNGDELWYCGTDQSDESREPTAFTQRMIESVGGQPVRLIRSAKAAHSNWAPALGIRYDGLYHVESFERIDSENSIRQRHRFKLVRVARQDPVRGGEGPEKRPTGQEIEELQKHKMLIGRVNRQM